MKEKDVREVHRIIEKWGDEFWNEGEGKCKNIYSFDEIVEMVNKEGYDLKLEKKVDLGGE